MGSKGYVRGNVHLSQKFTSNLEQFYQLHMEQPNFDDTVLLANTINEWVKKTTQGKLSTLVDSESLSNTVMLFINAIYFRGLWRYPFDQTTAKNFQVEPNVNITKEFVEQTAEFHYYYSKSLSAKILRLPYQGARFSMFLLLPFESDGLDTLINNLDSKNLSDEVENMEMTNVHVMLPKFRFDSSTKLNSVIKAVKKIEVLNNLVILCVFIFNSLESQRFLKTQQL